MGSYDYGALRGALDGMTPWKASALCAASAEKVTPIVGCLALPDTWSLVERSLAFCWRSLTTDVVAGELQQLQTALYASPEWNCDDNSCLPWVVKKALDFVNLALSAATSSSPSNHALTSLSLLIEFAGVIDHSAQREDDGVLRKTRIELQQTELQSQARSIEALQAATQPSEHLVAVVRQEARVVMAVVGGALPVYCYRYLQSLRDIGVGKGVAEI